MFEPHIGKKEAESALPEQIQGGATVFTHWKYSVRATYRDSQSLQAVIEAVKRYPSWDKINPRLVYVLVLLGRFTTTLQGLAPDGSLSPSAAVAVEGSELVFRGDNLMAKADSRSGSGRKLPPDPRPAKPLPASQPEKTWTAPTGYRISDTKNTRNGRLIKVRIEEPGEPLPDGDRLMAVWQHIYPQINRPLILTFYLPEMPLDGDPWAVVQRFQFYKGEVKPSIYLRSRTPDKYRPK